MLIIDGQYAKWEIIGWNWPFQGWLCICVGRKETAGPRALYCHKLLICTVIGLTPKIDWDVVIGV